MTCAHGFIGACAECDGSGQQPGTFEEPVPVVCLGSEGVRELEELMRVQIGRAELALIGAAREFAKAARAYAAQPSNAAWCLVEQRQESLLALARQFDHPIEAAAHFTAVETGNGEPEIWKDEQNRAYWADRSRVTDDHCARLPGCEVLTAVVRREGLTVLGFADEEAAAQGIETEVQP